MSLAKDAMHTAGPRVFVVFAVSMLLLPSHKQHGMVCQAMHHNIKVHLCRLGIEHPTRADTSTLQRLFSLVYLCCQRVAAAMAQSTWNGLSGCAPQCQVSATLRH